MTQERVAAGGQGVALAQRTVAEPALRYQDRPPADRAGAAAPPPRSWSIRTPRWALAALAALITAACLLQQPGKVAADTKLDVVFAPANFLEGALHLWRSDSNFGFIQDQAAGYLFPMGPFFLIGRDLGIPPWVVERLWWALILGLAMWGTVRVADALRLGRPWTRCAAGIGYSLSPFFLGQLTATSAGLLGGALLPWMMVPLIQATRPGSRPKDRPLLTARRGALLSALAVFGTGGINASVTLCVLVAPVLWLLICSGRGRRAWGMRIWWVVGVVLGCAWWVLALSFQGKYGLDFLAYTETPQTTTAFSPITHILGGTDNWLYFLQVAGPWLPTGWAYIVQVPLILSVAGVAAAGVFGLARRDLPARRYLLTLFALGVLVVGVGYTGQLGGPFHAVVRAALTSPFGAFRNVWKFQPIVMLPLALGVAHALAVFQAPARLAVRRPDALLVRTAPRLIGLAAVLALIGSAAPLVVNKTVRDGAFSKVPGYWQQAANWLGDNAEDSRTLMLPAEGFGEYSWGRPLDEPLQWLSHTEWASRSLVPLGDIGTTRLLDGIEQQLTIGSATGLDSVLQRSGVGYVLVRNDYGVQRADTPPSSAQVHRALSDSGLRRVASFGPVVPATPAPEELLLPKRPKPKSSYPALEVYAVPGTAAFVGAYPTSTAAVVSGGSEVYPQLAQHDVLASNRASILAADLPKDPAARPTGPNTAWIDTDSLGRRDTAFGQVHQGQSYLLGAKERVAGEDFDPRQRIDPEDVGHQTVAVYSGVKSVTASSYGFLFFKGQGTGPSAAVDGDERTFWQAQVDPKKKSTGAWLQIGLNSSIPVSQVTVRLLHDGPFRPDPQVMRVTTAAGSVDTPVRADEALQVLKAPGGPTTWVRVTFVKLTHQTDPSLGAGIRELSIPGIVIQRNALAPDDVAPDYKQQGSGALTYVFDRYRGDSTSPFSRDEETQLARDFTVPRDATFRVVGTAVPLPTLTNQAPKGWNKHSTFQVACGGGPDVVVDGSRYQTRLIVTPNELKELQPVELGLCAPGGRVSLSAGAHEIHTEETQQNALIDGLVLRSDERAAPKAPPLRTTKVGDWGSEHRSLTIGPGVASYLEVHESYNTSWAATLNGHRLQPVKLDGWQQGYLVPAGQGGTVLLANTAGESYRRNLVVGATLVVVLFVVLLFPAVRRRHGRGAPAGVAEGPTASGTAPGANGAGGRRWFGAEARAARANARVATVLWSEPGAGANDQSDSQARQRSKHRASKPPRRRWSGAGSDPATPPAIEAAPTPRALPAGPTAGTADPGATDGVTGAVGRDRTDEENGQATGELPLLGNGHGAPRRPPEEPTSGDGHPTSLTPGSSSRIPAAPAANGRFARNGDTSARDLDTHPQPVVQASAGAVAVITSAVYEPVEPEPSGRPERSEVALVVTVTALVGLLTGLGLLATPVLWLLTRRRLHVLPWIAASTMLVAGILAAVDPGSGPGATAGAFGWPSQLLGAVTLSSVLLAVARLTRRGSLRRKRVGMAPGAGRPGA